ncbi:hypothetical protein CS0771_02200 [Catellatospora sp. IY07-71]|nr:hypothetical protein CS0771_02200 [Catellatospora sp. IY07-71]
MKATERPESWATSDGTRASMRANRSRDTKPELALRRAVHALGLRYRVCSRPLLEVRRTADMVFSRQKVAVYLDGCFWHGCPSHHRAPRANGEYWSAKVERNRARDRSTDQALADAGWLTIRVWEHEDMAEAALRVVSAVRSRSSKS